MCFQISLQMMSRSDSEYEPATYGLQMQAIPSTRPLISPLLTNVVKVCLHKQPLRMYQSSIRSRLMATQLIQIDDQRSQLHQVDATSLLTMH